MTENLAWACDPYIGENIISIIIIVFKIIIVTITITIISIVITTINCAGQLIYVNCYGVTSAAYVLLTTLVVKSLLILRMENFS